MAWGAYMIKCYYDVKAELLEEANPANIWEGFANIYGFAAVGSMLLAYGLIGSVVGVVLVFIGIIVLRRRN